MALPITSIPVLTGEVARKLEERAQANYQKMLHRTPEEKQAVREKYNRGIEEVRRMLAKSHL